jgi:hypothetical protein
MSTATTPSGWVSTTIKALGVLVLGLGVLGIWSASVTVNVLHQLQISGTDPYGYVLAGISGCAEILKAACALALVAAIRKRYWFVGLSALLIWGATTAWSVRSAGGFIAHILVEQQESKGLKQAADNSLLREVEQLQQQLAFMRGTKVSTPKERVSLAEDIKVVERRYDRLRQQLDKREATTSADSLGKLLKDRYNIDISDSQIATVLLMILVLELGSNLSLVAFSQLLRWPPQVWDDPKPKAAAPAAPLPVVEPQQQLVAAEASSSAAVAFNPDFVTPTLVVDNDAEPLRGVGDGPAAHVPSFVGHLCTKRASNGGIWLMPDILREYRSWCVMRQVKPLTENCLGLALKRSGVQKIGQGTKATYKMPRVSPRVVA